MDAIFSGYHSGPKNIDTGAKRRDSAGTGNNDPPRWAEGIAHRLQLVRNVLYGLVDGLDVADFVIGNVDPKFVFESHDDLDDI